MASRNVKRPPPLSVRKLADKLGVSHPALLKWIENPQWTFGKGPWSASIVPQIEAWREKYLKAAATIGDAPTASKESLDKHKLECQLLGVRILKEKLLYDTRKGVLLDKREIEAREVRQATAVKQSLMGLKSLPVKMQGMSVQQQEVFLESFARDVCNTFAKSRIDL